MNLTTLIETAQSRVEKLFTLYLKNSQNPAPSLQEAMAYGVFNGGKRIRPLLAYATGLALDAALDDIDAPACALELIHSYSLIHDDLPAMDNADLRRGKPSCHKAFNEALAILAGDALQPLAFEIILSHPAKLDAEQRLFMMKILSQAIGPTGMAAGQALDLAGMNSLESLTEMYHLKTGALLVASAQLGAIAANKYDTKTLSALEKYAGNIGLAFQIQDDLLDLESPEITGKPKGLDINNNKITYPSLLGVEKTREKIEELFRNALAELEPLGKKGDILREFAMVLLRRKK